MYNKFEIIGAGISVAFMAIAIFVLQSRTAGLATNTGQAAQVVRSDTVVVQPGESMDRARAEAYVEAANSRGEIERLVVDDIRIGTGPAVEGGDTVRVHYVGRLQNGQEFDNSRRRGETFEFTVGDGRVIAGWEQGVIGMQTGGERILVIPPELAYGQNGFGPIPGGATLVFAIELLEIE